MHAFNPARVLIAVILLAAGALTTVHVAGASSNQPATQPTSAPATAAVSLAQARKGFVTKLKPEKSPLAVEPFKAATPPPGAYQLVHYTSPAGKLVAYLSPDPRDGKKHPVVIWGQGGYGGISEAAWEKQPAENAQTPAAFREAGIVVMVPAWRGRNDNPGRFEMWLGEIDDALAAIDFVAKVPYVDASRIYFVGHSTGGTVALLTGESSDKLRASFSLDGCPDIGRLVKISPKHPAPWIEGDPREAKLRSAIYWVEASKTPTWFFGNNETWYSAPAMDMARRARAAGAPFNALSLQGATHFDMVRPVTELLAAKINADMGKTCNIQISPAEVEQAYHKVFPAKTITCIAPATTQVHMTAGAHEWVRQIAKKWDLPVEKVFLLIGVKDGNLIVYTDKEPQEYFYTTVVDGVTVQVDDTAAAKGQVFEVDRHGGRAVVTTK